MAKGDCYTNANYDRSLLYVCVAWTTLVGKVNTLVHCASSEVFVMNV